jgi:cytochrome b561
MPPTEPPAWSRAQRRLHWWSAALVFLGALVAVAMVRVPLVWLLEKFLLYQLHKTIGVTVAALALARLFLRARRGRPAWPAGLPAAGLARAGQAGLYLLLLAVPTLGYLSADAAPANIPTLFLAVIPLPRLLAPDSGLYALLRPAHIAAALLLLALAAGHAAMAIHHHRRGLPLLRAMWKG